MANGVNTAGFKGTVDDVRWARLIPRAGSAPYGVVNPGDCKVAIASGDRTVSVAATSANGGCWGWGVFCEFNAATNLALAAPASGSRWDLIALRRDWAARTVTPVVVAGNATKGLPTGRKVGPGVLDDQPLALVRVTAGSASISEIVDLRCWSGNNVVALDALALNYLDHVGSSVRIGATTWDRMVDAGGGLSWSRSIAGGAIGYSRTGGYREPTAANGNIHTINIPDPGFPHHIVASATVEAGGGGAGTRWNMTLAVNGAVLDSSRGDAVAPWFQVKGTTYNPRTGPSVVSLDASRMVGNGAFGVSAYNQYFGALVIPAYA